MSANQSQDVGESASSQAKVSAIQSAIERADFESALALYRDAHNTALSTGTYRDFWESCARECPYYMGQIGWLVGAGPSEFDYFQELIEDTGSDWWRDTLESRIFAHLDHDAGPRNLSATILPVSMLYENAGHAGRLGPSTVVRVGKQRKAVTALIDTARDAVYFDRKRHDTEHFQHKAVGNIFSTEEWDGSPSSYSRVVLEEFSIGEYSGSVFGTTIDSGLSLGHVLILGILPLLRHDAACFDWEMRALHLGSLGPCGSPQRTSPHRAWLHSRILAPFVEVRMPDGSTLEGLIDTGSDYTLCKREFAENYRGVRLPFGDHAALTVECADGANRIKQDYPHDMVIGMDTLFDFAAFGWELNPFRMYFVPKRKDSAEHLSFLERTVNTLISSVEQGDFKTALEANRRALVHSVSTSSAWDEYAELCSGVCPIIGQLGWLTGATASEFSFLDDSVDVISQDQSRQDWRDYADATLFKHLQKVGEPMPIDANQLPLLPGREATGAIRPWVSVRLKDSDSVIHAVVDTGSSLVMFDEMFQAHHSLSTSALTDFSTHTTWSGDVRRASWVSLDEITFGEQVESAVLATLVAGTTDQEDELTIGNRLLLRHDAVCFDWKAQTLHLGELGPCEDSERVATYKSWLDSQSLVPVLEFHDSDGNAMTALISTGTKSNVCKSDLVGRKFTFGEHRLLTASCDSDAETVFDDYRYDMIIGMETLSEFSVWGWQLDPFRMYFVPPTSTRNE